MCAQVTVGGEIALPAAGSEPDMRREASCSPLFSTRAVVISTATGILAAPFDSGLCGGV